MALAVRELELIIIASDQASSTLARVGGAMTILGGAAAALGIKWGRELGEMTGEAIDFSNDAALAFTQMFDKTGATIEDVGDMLLGVMREVPRPVEELSEALFDVFSSIDATIPEAEAILKRVGAAALAGQVDVRSAMIPTIAVMNAYGLGAESIDGILDTQFKTVQKGILTYEELTSNIGKVIPAAVAAGQTFETSSAAYAFLTRQGLNAAMASTSVARALELLARPKSVKGLEKVGITVRDATGEFLPLNEIMSQIGQKWEGLTAPERKQAFQEIFGTGSIQARRFFDLAIPNWQELNALTEEFSNSAGAMDQAYDTMFNEPRAQIDLLKNRLAALRIEIGEQFIPLIEQYLLPLADQFFDWWEALTPDDKGIIAKWSAIGAAALTAFGSMTAAAGVLVLIGHVWSALGPVLAGGALAFGKFLLIAGLIAGAAWLIYDNWDTIVEWWNNTLKPAIDAVVEWFKPLAESVWEAVKNAGVSIWEALVDAWEELAPVVQEVWEAIRDSGVWEWLQERVGQVVDILVSYFEFLGEHLPGLIEKVVDIITWIWDNWGEEIVTIVGNVFGFIGDLIEGFLTIVQGFVDILDGIFSGDWSQVWDGIVTVAEGAWGIMTGLFDTIASNIAALFGFEWGGWRETWEAVSQWWRDWWAGVVEWWNGIMNGIGEWWHGVWTGVRDWFVGVWNGIYEWFVGIWNSIVEWWSGLLAGVAEWWNGVWQPIADFFRGVWEGIVSFFQGIWESDIAQFIRDILGIIYEVIRIAFTAAWEFIKMIWENVSEFVQTVWNNIKTVAGIVFGAIWLVIKTVFTTVKNWIINTWNTIKDWLSVAWGVIKSVASAVWSGIKTVIINPIIATWNAIVSWWNTIKGWLNTLWNNIKTIASTVWNAVKRAVIDPIISLWNTIVSWWSTIKNWLSTTWNNIKTTASNVWTEIKNKVTGPINTVKSAISGFVDGIVSKIRYLWDKATYWVGRIRDALSKLDPREWFSPPITSTVGAGMDALYNVVQGGLVDIDDKAAREVASIRAKIADLRLGQSEYERLSNRQPNVITSGAGTYRPPVTVINNNYGTSSTGIQQQSSWALRMG